MNKLNPIVLTVTCLLSIAAACANKAQTEPQAPPVLMTPAAGAQPAPTAATLTDRAPQGAKLTPIDTISQPMDASSSMGGDAGVIPQGSGGSSGHSGHGGTGGGEGSR
jgi:hypothetical protein